MKHRRKRMLEPKKEQYPYCPIRFTMLLPDGLSAVTGLEWFDNKTGEHSRIAFRRGFCSCSAERRKGWRNNEAR
jgi:hypothetical protein